MTSTPFTMTHRTPDDADAAPSLLRGRDIRVALQGNPVLRGVHIRVQPRETVALLGGNGSGKTTLVRTLLGLQPRAGGEVDLFGTPLGRFREWSRIGYVPQRGSASATGATVREVVGSGRLSRRRWFLPPSGADRDAVRRALEQVDLTPLAGREYTRMSGGQQQRALIARALVSEPELLVLDEPLAGLDMRTQDSLAALLGELKAQGLGVLVVLHELGPLEPLIDRSVVLRAGEVIHDGPLRSGAPGRDDHHHDGDPEPSPRGVLTGVADHELHRHHHGER